MAWMDKTQAGSLSVYHPPLSAIRNRPHAKELRHASTRLAGGACACPHLWGYEVRRAKA
jgi:hypothetical protein